MPETFHVVPCHVGVGKPGPDECTWDQQKWYQGIVDKQGFDTEVDKKPVIEQAEYWIKNKGLVPALTDIGDPRYILR